MIRPFVFLNTIVHSCKVPIQAKQGEWRFFTLHSPLTHATKNITKKGDMEIKN